MGKKGPSKHMKREKSPKFWPIHRKEKKWSVRPKPVSHKTQVTMPLTVVIRDSLKFANTAKEAKLIINQGKVIVDGKTRLYERYSIGLMDVLELPDADIRYRVLPQHGGRFILHPIPKEEASFKLCRIVGKTSVKNGLTQLNLHDGRNILIDKDEYDVGDVIKLDIPRQEITDHIAFKPGVRAIITGGRSQGKKGILMELGSEPGKKKTATIRTPENEDVRTLAGYVFIVGKETPLISLPGE